MSKSHSLTSFLYVCPFVHTNVLGMDVHDNCEFKTLDILVRVMDMSYKTIPVILMHCFSSNHIHV